jgi:HEPN domain-containing protein
MAHDPVKVADALAWMQKADSDMRCAVLDSGATPPLLEDALFHCQQVVEKSLKAWLTWNDIPFRKTHSIEELGEACIGTAPELSEILDRAVPLTEYAWAYRYPGLPEEPSTGEVDGAIEIAREVLRIVTARLPEEARPKEAE